MICMPTPSNTVPAAVCPDCGAVASYTEPDRPTRTPATNPSTPDECACRCHEAWRFVNHRQLAS